MVGNIITLLTAAKSSPGANLVPLYYISAIVVSVGTAVWALSRWFEKQRQKWQSEAVHDTQISDILQANTEAATKNTVAIDKLTKEMGAFANKVESELNGHTNRLERLEEYAMYGTAPYHYLGRRPRNGKPTDDDTGA